MNPDDLGACTEDFDLYSLKPSLELYEIAALLVGFHPEKLRRYCEHKHNTSWAMRGNPRASTESTMGFLHEPGEMGGLDFERLYKKLSFVLDNASPCKRESRQDWPAILSRAKIPIPGWLGEPESASPAEECQGEADYLAVIGRLMLLARDLQAEAIFYKANPRRRYARGDGLSKSAIAQDLQEVADKVGLSTEGCGDKKTRVILAAAIKAVSKKDN